MKRTLLTILLLLMLSTPASSQRRRMRGVKFQGSSVYKGDTIDHFSIVPVYISNKPVNMRHYQRLVDAVKKVYPLAQVARAKMEGMEQHLLTLSKKEQRAYIKKCYKEILDDFFPRFLEVVANDEYRDSIEEIRIEGHTDSDGGYLYNIQLSQNRAREVLDYCLGLVENNEKYSDMVDWVKFKITANGLSYSHPILNSDGTENKDLSRRVEFKVRTNAEKQLEEIAKIRL